MTIDFFLLIKGSKTRFAQVKRVFFVLDFR